ncbi:MAG: EAL domain-containing protein [Methylobacteriaceae bacterium]|nr:EAL domain-containing protein [Methylobacteriaceae bacterium]
MNSKGGKIEGVTTPFIVAVAVLIGAIVAAVSALVPSTMREATLDTVRRAAIDTAETIKLTHERYVLSLGPGRRPAAGRAGESGPPSPGAFLAELSADTQGRPNRFAVVSPYRWAGRDRPPLDEFQRQAWNVFARAPDVVFTSEQTIEGRRYLRLAVPEKMTSKACVECHNADPASPKRDWAVGDVAGIVDVTKLIEPNLATAERHGTAIVSFVVGAGVFAAMLVVLLNVSSVRRARERYEARKRIEYLAYFDTLTGALNRGHFLGELDEWLKSTEARARGVAIHFVDLDRFKEVNDTLGHDVGDELVRQTVQRLQKVCAKNDLVGRVGGDEFVIAQWKVVSRKQVEERAAAIVHALAQPFIVRDNRITVSASVGVVDRLLTQSATDMLKCADLALYRAKALGRNRYVVFNEQIAAEHAEQLRLEQRVREALAKSDFRLFFQPICDARTGRVEGFETLLRLADADGRQVPAQQFVACAESMGLIANIDEWVLRNACRAAAAWPRSVTVAVNLSPANFGRASITGRRLRRLVADVLAETGLEASRLELEITEGILLENTDEVIDELKGLKELGVAIALDDFGAGYSGLNYLWKFPFDKLKIDASFIRAMESEDAVMPPILRAIVTLGRELGLTVCAEGVETRAEADLLVGLGAQQIQGYLYGRPTPESEVAPLLLSDAAARLRDQAPAIAGPAPRALAG